MTKVVKASIAVPITFAFVFLLAVLPRLLQIDESSGALRLNWADSFSSVKAYFAGLGTGETFRFLSGRTEHSFWDTIGSYFSVSLFYITAGALIGMTIGILVGIYFSLSRAEWLKRLVDLIGALPDFVLILLLQMLFVFVFQKTGVLVFQVASLNTDEPAIVLPLVSAVIIPANFLLRNVAMQMKLTLTEDYINYAKARGLGKSYIVFFHALPNVLPYIKADLHKLLGILMGNLFIVEYLYNLHGVTKLLFADAYAYEGYQYPLVVNGLFTLLLLYVVVYFVLRLYLWGWKKVFVR
ncbi:ABC transporter permease subunit [Paenibacillaceae bacterium WGS1546]|uniref:ABC transporter permease subunit n=1 Tax=Cohnella sp. WGS1546 TaxID=3366810 RepID=UPI00372D1692